MWSPVFIFGGSKLPPYSLKNQNHKTTVGNGLDRSEINLPCQREVAFSKKMTEGFLFKNIKQR